MRHNRELYLRGDSLRVTFAGACYREERKTVCGRHGSPLLSPPIKQNVDDGEQHYVSSCSFISKKMWYSVRILQRCACWVGQILGYLLFRIFVLQRSDLQTLPRYWAECRYDRNILPNICVLLRTISRPYPTTWLPRVRTFEMLKCSEYPTQYTLGKDPTLVPNLILHVGRVRDQRFKPIHIALVSSLAVSAQATTCRLIGAAAQATPFGQQEPVASFLGPTEVAELNPALQNRSRITPQHNDVNPKKWR